MRKLKVDIWSDVVCPFCYIGKRKFEQGLEQFDYKDDIEIEWHSFQLDPNTPSNVDKDVYTYLAERKGGTREWSLNMHRNVVQMAKEVGLDYNFDIAKIANTFNAHRLQHYAASKGLGNIIEEALFKAYFTNGKNIGSIDELVAIGVGEGLNESELRKVLESDAYSNEVRKDIATAQQFQISGVPFFVFNMKYGVSGAQPAEAFLETLKVAHNDWKTENVSTLKNMNSEDGASCDIDGNC